MAKKVANKPKTKLVAYYRVSTKKQGISGLGLEAQQSIVKEFAKSQGLKIIGEYTEVESGRNSDRPKLRDAISHVRMGDDILLAVAKLDRLARNVAFTSALMESNVDFRACDNPSASNFTIQILAACAEKEALDASRRTRDALGAAKAKGVLLGSARPGHWKGREHKRGWKRGAEVSAEIRSQRCREAYEFLLPQMKAMQAQFEIQSEEAKKASPIKVAEIRKRYADQIKKTLQASPKSKSAVTELESMRDEEISQVRAEARIPVYEMLAKWLNDNGHQTSSGNPFSAATVWRILKRDASKRSA